MNEKSSGEEICFKKQLEVEEREGLQGLTKPLQFSADFPKEKSKRQPLHIVDFFEEVIKET